jgi:hypothetical protein
MKRLIAAALLTITMCLMTPGAAQACVNCPCLNIKKDGPCLLR